MQYLHTTVFMPGSPTGADRHTMKMLSVLRTFYGEIVFNLHILLPNYVMDAGFCTYKQRRIQVIIIHGKKMLLVWLSGMS